MDIKDSKRFTELKIPPDTNLYYKRDLQAMKIILK